MIKYLEGFDNIYSIDNFGNFYKRGKLMKPYIINSGYKAIKFTYKGVVYHKLIHRLVAEYFIPKDNEDYNIVDHIDSNKLNNNSENLRWCTQHQNNHYHGFEYNSGTNNYKSIFNREDVINIRTLHEVNGLRNVDIYKIYPNVSHTAIDQVIQYRTYRNI